MTGQVLHLEPVSVTQMDYVRDAQRENPGTHTLAHAHRPQEARPSFWLGP